MKNLSDDKILGVGCHIFLRHLKSEQVTQVTHQSNQVKQDYIGTNPKATEKQIKYLIGLGFKGDTDKLNKFEAKALIEKLKNEKQEDY
mgnify:CR=1 FL=1